MSFLLPDSFPFAGIVDADDTPCNPESDDWAAAPIELVFFKDIILTQDCLVIRQIFQTTKRQASDDDYIQVVTWNGKKYLYNGHHRAVKAALSSEVGMLARLYQL